MFCPKISTFTCNLPHFQLPFNFKDLFIEEGERVSEKEHKREKGQREKQTSTERESDVDLNPRTPGS